jgi:CHAT domain-containing protein/Tfp pilus assembly protein PilF
MERGEWAEALADADSGPGRYRGGPGQWAWPFQVLKAEVLVRQGLSRDALDLLNPEPPPSLTGSEFAVRRRIAQAAGNSFLQRFPEAGRCLQQAETLAAASAPDLLGEVALRRGTLGLLQGDLNRARNDYRSALQFARAHRQPFLEAASLGSLGLIEMRSEHYDEAIDFDLEAFELSVSLNAKPSTARILGNLGWSYFELGDVERAESYFVKAEKAASDLGAVRDQIVWLTNIGLVAFDRGDLDSAETSYQRALGSARKLGNQPLVTQSLNDLAFVSLRRGKFDQAGQYSREAQALAGESGDHVGESYSQLIAGRIAAARGMPGVAEGIFQRLRDDSALETSLRIEARANLARLYAQERRPAEAEQEYRGGILVLRHARATLNREESKLSFQTTERMLFDDYINFLIDLGRKTEALEVADLSRANSLREGLGADAPDAPLSKAGAMTEGAGRQIHAAILSYWLGPVHSYVWSVQPSGQVALFVLPPEKEIARYVESYREALLGPWDVLETMNPVGQKLFEMLVAPAKASIAGQRRIVIIQDGALYGLNFETLLVPGAQLHYWIDDVTLTSASSIALLAGAPRRRTGPSSRLLLIGDPLSPGKEYPPLPHAAPEMKDIQAFFTPRELTVASGAAATPAAYLRGTPGRYSYIHFVAHGAANRISPLDSAIILSADGESFKLYARDIIKGRLHADLVTISSCYGAGLRAYKGEGLVGLSWAFLRAGAHNVIGALWEANDTSTPLLMRELYRALRSGHDPASSLRSAKLTLIHSGSVYKKPFYWAAFQVYAGS